MPAVSVIIPAYRVSPYIAETLESVRAQTFRDYEAIVINDGSPDTAELERALRPYAAEVVYLKQENRGPAAARNLGIRGARGEYLAFLDGDDLWAPEYLARQVQALRDDPALDLIYTDALIFGPAPTAGSRFMQICPSEGPVTVRSLVEQTCVVITSCTVARRAAVLEAGLFDEDPAVQTSEDFELWVRLAVNGRRLAYRREPLGRRREHAAALTANPERHSRAALAAYQKVRDLPGLPAELRPVVEAAGRRCYRGLCLDAAKHHLRQRQYPRAMALFREGAGAGRKVRLILFCLRVWPGLAWGLNACWERARAIARSSRRVPAPATPTSGSGR